MPAVCTGGDQTCRAIAPHRHEAVAVMNDGIEAESHGRCPGNGGLTDPTFAAEEQDLPAAREL